MFNQILCVFFATVSQISDGMVFGWASPAIPLLLQPGSPIKITEEDVVWIESVYWIGGICGVPITIALVNRIGRRNSLIFSNSLNLLHWILIICTGNVYALYMARFITGVSSDISFVAAPMYIAELSEPRIRGVLTSFTHLMVLTGVLIVYAVLPYVSIVTSSLLGCVFLVIQLAALPWFPETPYYHLLHKDVIEAAKSLRFFRRHKSPECVQDELADIRTCVMRENENTVSFVEFWTVSSNRRSILITVILNASEHFAGFAVIIMNLHLILKDSLVGLDSQHMATMFAGLMLIAASITTAVIDNFDRKRLLVISAFMTGASLAVLAAYFKLRHLADLSYVPVVAIVCYIFSFKLGLAIIPYILVAEIFPTNSKACGIAISDMSYVTFAAISIHFYQYTLGLYGNFVPILTFALCSFLTVAFVVFCVPETRGKSLHQIQAELNGSLGAGRYCGYQVIGDER